MTSRRQFNDMQSTEPPDTREALLDAAPHAALLPWGALACLGSANAAEAVEVLCASYLLKGLSGAPARAAVSSGVYAGMLIGGVGGGLLGDAMGRARVICLMMVLAFVGGIGAACSGGVAAMACWRVLAGTGVGGATPPLFALASELSDGPACGRGVAFVASHWMLGSLFAATLAKATLPADLTVDFAACDQPWRRYAFVCALPSLCVAVLFFCKGNLDRGRTVSTAEPARFPPAEKRLLAIMGCTFFGLYFGYYGLSTWIAVLVDSAGIGDAYTVAIYYALATLPGNLIGYLLIDRIGRRRLLAGAMGLSACFGVVLVLALAVAPEAGRATLAVAAALLVNASTTAGFAALDALAAESFDSKRKATAVGLLCAVGRVASICAQVVNASLARSPARLVAVTTLLMALGAASVFFVPALPQPESVVETTADDAGGAPLV